MGYTNVQADVNFYRQSLNADGIKDVTGPYTSLYEDVFRAITVTTDSVVSVTSYVGDSLSNQFLFAGTEIYGLFSSVTIHSGNAILHLAGASYISEIVNQYSASGIPLGFYEEGTQCLSQKISALLTQGVFDDASWVMVPSQYKEDTVRAFKPTSTLGDLAFTRSSDATFTDSTGVVRRSPWNLVQFSEQFDNAYWPKPSGTISANVTTAPNGTITADKYIVNNGQPTNSPILSTFAFNTNTAYTLSLYVKKADYDTASIRLYTDQTGFSTCSFNLANGTVSGGTISALSNSWFRVSVSFTTASTVTNGQFQLIRDAQIRDGVAGIFIWGAQLVEGTEALPYFATTDRLNVPRLDYSNADGTLSTCPRLLLEPQRTNSIRNSSMVGAVAGTPGTAPTNWSTGNAGLTRTIIGTGTENGLPYFDVRFNGTATGPLVNLNLEGTQVISATTGQTWTTSIWSKIVANSSAGSISYLLSLIERNSFGAYLVDYAQTFTNTTTLQRFSFVRATANASTAFVQPGLYISITNGAAYDFTIRIAAPQMELGAYATTWVPTTTTAVTRIGDSTFKAGLSSLFGTEGTWFIEMSPSSVGVSTTAFKKVIGLYQVNGSIADCIYLEEYNGNWGVFVRKGNTTILSRTYGTQPRKLAVTFGATGSRIYIDGVQATSTASNTSISPIQVSVTQNTGGAIETVLNVTQSAYIPTPLTQTQLAALTTL